VLAGTDSGSQGATEVCEIQAAARHLADATILPRDIIDSDTAVTHPGFVTIPEQKMGSDFTD
jgi:hypothetical protein